MKKTLLPLALVGAAALAGAAAGSVGPLRGLVAIVLPYCALAALLGGLSWKVVRWSLAPVPFRIPAVCGQEKSLPWIRQAKLESPHTTLGVIGRMALEILLFRSLFRGSHARLDGGPRLIQGEAKWLWLAALSFHWSLLTIVVRHLRLLAEPVPAIAFWLDRIDGFFQVGVPALYVTDIVVLVALAYLLQRRFRDPQIHHISLFTDYFALYLLGAIAVTGVWMRYFSRIDAIAVKQLAIGLTTFAPVIPAALGALFYAHLVLVCVLAAYLPLSKLLHAPGVFLSPTRNLANNNRMRRHVNPWNYPVAVHTYEEWEEEFHDKIAGAGLPLERS
jgi:nitrate reductase gamma subunit